MSLLEVRDLTVRDSLTGALIVRDVHFCLEPGTCLGVVGESGSGKSTLAAMLGEQGWRLMGDEFTLIAPASGEALGFLRPVSLKNQAIAAMAERVCEDRFGPLLFLR